MFHKNIQLLDEFADFRISLKTLYIPQWRLLAVFHDKYSLPSLKYSVIESHLLAVGAQAEQAQKETEGPKNTFSKETQMTE